MFVNNPNDGCLDYSSQDGEVHRDVAPLFYVKTIIRSVENPNGLEKWIIHVNDHNKREYDFVLPAESVYQANFLATLSKEGIIVSPFWAEHIIAHLLYGKKKCEETDNIVYQNTVLGWYPFNDKAYYFYDETEVDGKKSFTTRKKFKFQKGRREDYLEFLKEVVFPSTELSLALAIGYSAVVVSRLNEELDLRYNYR